MVQKRNDAQSRVSKKNKIDPNLSPDELLKLSTVPLWNVPYEEQVSEMREKLLIFAFFLLVIEVVNGFFFQLAVKMKNMKTILEELSRELLRDNKFNKTVDFLEERCKKNNGLVCELSDIRHVPFEEFQHGYRNKCEFSIGSIFCCIITISILVKSLIPSYRNERRNRFENYWIPIWSLR